MARLLFFGKLADAAGARQRDLPLGDAQTVGDLVSALGKQEAALGAALQEKSVRVIVNEKMAARDSAISDGDEIAFLPPVSGG
ncbi:MAG: molybdopterin synthase sulfur carrier subunit [Parvularcula sp.]|nr:molybdopterin synthase sulfur carrier subunit [Parvularcula sp.]